jgi:hypothetical protein
MEQSHAEPFLESLNMSARGGLRNSQAAGGRREAPGLHHAREGCDAIERVHGAIVLFSGLFVHKFPANRRRPAGLA